MATTLRIDVADQPNHRKGKRELSTAWVDDMTRHYLEKSHALEEEVRRAAALRAAGMALTHPCRARTSPRRGCRHPGHAADVARLREWLDGLGLLPVEAPEPEAEPARAKPVSRRQPDWSWTEDAACRGEDLVLFYGPDGERQPERDVRELKAVVICRSCPVTSPCLEWALAEREHGYWGGTNEDQRTSLRRRRARLARVEADREEAS